LSNWICNKCNIEMEDVSDIGLVFKDIDLPPAVGYRCPSCHIEFLERDFVVNELNQAEEMLEGK